MISQRWSIALCSITETWPFDNLAGKGRRRKDAQGQTGEMGMSFNWESWGEHCSHKLFSPPSILKAAPTGQKSNRAIESGNGKETRGPQFIFPFVQDSSTKKLHPHHLQGKTCPLISNPPKQNDLNPLQGVETLPVEQILAIDSL